MDSSPLVDPWIAAQIAAAVAPYAGRLPAEELEWMREQLAELLTHDEEAARLLRRAHPRDVDASGERAYGEAAEAAEANRAPGRTKAG